MQKTNVEAREKEAATTLHHAASDGYDVMPPLLGQNTNVEAEE